MIGLWRLYRHLVVCACKSGDVTTEFHACIPGKQPHNSLVVFSISLCNFVIIYILNILIQMNLSYLRAEGLSDLLSMRKVFEALRAVGSTF